jgi:membrane-bound lytic murein transglycosylase D
VIARSQEFFPLIEKELWQYNLPSELKYLPVAVSDLDPVKVGADGGSGLWELQYITARRYGLNVNSYVDERRDIRKSTAVAIRYITDLHKQYNNWALTLLAFVSSPSDVNAAMGRADSEKEFWKIYSKLDDPGKQEFADFIAVAYLMNYYNDYGIQKRSPSKPVQCKSYTIDRNIDIAELCTRLNISESELRRLNPLFRGNVIPAGMNLQINIPVALTARYESIKDTLPVAHNNTHNIDVSRTFYFDENNYRDDHTVTSNPNVVKNTSGNTATTMTTTSTSIEKSYYKVVNGDNLGRVAAKYHVTIEQLKSWNHLKNDVIYVGQKLVIQKEVKTTVTVPVTSANTEKTTTNTPVTSTGKTVTQTTTNTSTQPVTNSSSPKKTGGGWVTYKVRSGDSVWRIATKYGVSESDIRKNNKLSGNLIHPGQVLKIKKS